MSVCIDACVLGCDRHLVIDDDFRWESAVPPGTWHLSAALKRGDVKCLDTVLKLNSKSIDVMPPSKFVAAMTSVVSGPVQGLPWGLILPKQAYRAFLERLVNEVKETFTQLNFSFYESTWCPQGIVLDSLRPAKIDERRFDEIMRDCGMNRRPVESFRPDNTGHATPVAYNRFGTRTGRLTVESGPDILTLKKSYRDVIVPSQVGGAIVSLDFSALEARVLLHEAGGSCDEDDLYMSISTQVFGGTVDRKAVKGAVISELYGSSKVALGNALHISGKELDDFVAKVKSYFKTGELKKRVKDEFLKFGFITNRYGRRVAIEDPFDHIFVNSYAQSTGVDVSLLGFSNIVKSLSSRQGTRPLFVLHDALLLDVAPEDLEHVLSIKSVQIPGYVQKFPIKAEVLRALYK